MKVLIVINDLGSGGAQRSLVSFLTCLAENNNLKYYDIDLLVSNRLGVFKDRIPNGINLLCTDKKLIWMNCPLKSKALRKSFSVLCLMMKIKWMLTLRYKRKTREYFTGKSLWESWKRYIPDSEKEYDIAISYMDGWPNYYVIEKVRARKKILWIHNEYQKLGYDPNYDLKYYTQCDGIITISERCKSSFLEIFPQFTTKIHVLENISLSNEIHQRAEEFEPEEFIINKDKWKLVSIGRLSYQKGFDIAINAARELHEKLVPFIWVILGDGPDHEKLASLIKEHKLEKQVFLLGIKDNPYPYISGADVFVQTSRFEGKSIVLDEAKILAKPIVVTKYDTVFDTIEDNRTGIIVEMTAASIANGIIRLLDDSKLRKSLSDNLESNNTGNEKELEKYINIML